MANSSVGRKIKYGFVVGVLVIALIYVFINLYTNPYNSLYQLLEDILVVCLAYFGIRFLIIYFMDNSSGLQNIDNFFNRSIDDLFNAIGHRSNSYNNGNDNRQTYSRRYRDYDNQNNYPYDRDYPYNSYTNEPRTNYPKTNKRNLDDIDRSFSKRLDKIDREADDLIGGKRNKRKKDPF